MASASGWIKPFALVTGVLATGCCAFAGIWLLNETQWGQEQDSVVWSALGLYFLGKALFVGPMLILTGYTVANRWGSGAPTVAAPPKPEFQVPSRAMPPGEARN